MSHAAAYIVPEGFLNGLTMLGGRFAQHWQATSIPADPTRALVVIHWDNPNAEAEFEARPEVLALGAPWEPIPAEVAPLLESLADPAFTPNALTAAARTGGAMLTDTVAQPDTVYSALRKTSIGRSVR